MKQIVFNGVGATARRHKHRLLQAAAHVIDSGVFLEGSQTRRLETSLQHLWGGYVTTVASGHDALFLALGALKLTANDEVIFPVNAYPTAFPVVLAGCRPVPVDADENGQLDPVGLEAAVTSQTKAVIVVHLYGLVGELKKIREICRKKKLVLIEDCAQAFGSMYGGKPVGTIGDIGCFSFYPTKNLGALGDGGAIRTSRKEWHAFFLAAKAYGERARYQSEFVAGHSRLPELQAAGLNVYFRYVDGEAVRRRRVWTWYQEALNNAHLGQAVRVLVSHKDSDAVPHLLVIDAKNRNRLQKHLAKRGIDTRIHYPQPIHHVPAFRFLGYQQGRFSVAERLAGTIISLPFHPYLMRRDVVAVVECIGDFFHGKKNH